MLVLFIVFSLPTGDELAVSVLAHLRVAPRRCADGEQAASSNRVTLKPAKEFLMTAENGATPTRFSLKKTILFACVAILLVWLCVEAILHTSTYFGILPYIPTLTPSLYTGENREVQDG